MDTTERDAADAADPADPRDEGPRSLEVSALDAAALRRLEQALEVIGAHCASIGVRMLRAGHPPRRA